MALGYSSSAEANSYLRKKTEPLFSNQIDRNLTQEVILRNDFKAIIKDLPRRARQPLNKKKITSYRRPSNINHQKNTRLKLIFVVYIVTGILLIIGTIIRASKWRKPIENKNETD